MERYLAHIAADGREQTVAEHNRGVAELAASFAAPFGMEEQAFLAGMAHDIGKYSDGFQHRLHGGPKVDHSTSGAVECVCAVECVYNSLYIAGMCVAGHHAGLADFGNDCDTAVTDTFIGRMRRAWQEKRNTVYLKEQGALPTPPIIPSSNRFEEAMCCRMLFSTLVDADYLDTERFMKGSGRRIGGYDLNVLNERLDAHLQRFATPTTSVGKIRQAVLADCRAAAEQEVGLFSLTVPTGGGKTLSSLSFALRHALRNGLKRVIYVVPFTTIIEQTADVFRSIVGADAVLEHHANVTPQEADENGNPSTLTLATENWDAPIIVTTAVQFFESLYAATPAKCRKLHNVAESVLIFDEAQMIPTAHLRPCIAAIGTLVSGYRVSAVLCTATQPALEDLFAKYAKDFVMREINTRLAETFAALTRVTYCDLGRISLPELATAIADERQALCVVNTRQRAKELYELLPEEGRYHLSTLMYPEHRRNVLCEIRARLRQGLPCVVVSTSLIEAGVDVDFPTVYRQRAGLDSIVQAAGRCNREGKRPISDSKVYVFDTDGASPKMLRVNIGATNDAMRGKDDWGTEDSIRRYFREYRALRGDDIDASNAYKHLHDGISGCLLPIRTVARDFHLIESDMRTIYVPTENNRALIEALRTGDVARDTLRRMGQFAIGVYDEHYRRLLSAGDVEAWCEDGAILVNPSLYSQETGLSLEADTGKAEFV